MNVQLISRKLKTPVRLPLLFYIVMLEARKYTKIHKKFLQNIL